MRKCATKDSKIADLATRKMVKENLLIKMIEQYCNIINKTGTFFLSQTTQNWLNELIFLY